MKTVGWIAGRIGRGLLAGFLGTLAMTVSSTIEMKLRDRPASEVPAKAAEKVLDVEPESKAAEQRLSNLVHLAYGTAWGGFRGLLDVVGLRGAPASLVHFGAVWIGAMIVQPALRVTPPPTEWSETNLAIDGFHHSVYALATGATYDAIAGTGRESMGSA